MRKWPQSPRSWQPMDNKHLWGRMAMSLCRCPYTRPDQYLAPEAHAKNCPYRKAREILAPYELVPKVARKETSVGATTPFVQ